MARATQLLDPETLRGQRFSFYPAIRGIQHNEWTLRGSTWSEVQVRNGSSGQEIWVPRSVLDEVSSSDSPVLIVGLRRELEFKAGGVYPYRETITDLPLAAPSRQASAPPQAPPKNVSLNRADARTLRLLGLAVCLPVLAGVLVFAVVVGGLHNPFEALLEADTSTADQRYLGLAASTHYFEVVDRLGDPETEQWISGEEDELQFQALHYGARGYIVVLMGGTRAEMRYLGTVHDPTRRVLDSARLERGGDTSSMMRNLPEF